MYASNSLFGADKVYIIVGVYPAVARLRSLYPYYAHAGVLFCTQDRAWSAVLYLCRGDKPGDKAIASI